MSKYITSKDFEDFKKEILGVIKSVDKISGTADLTNIKASEASKTSEVEKKVEIEDESVKPEKMPVPPGWRKIVDETLGMDFGIDVVYPSSGSGFLFKVIVPAEKSNASPAHKEFYRVDIRTKAISYSDGIEGVKKFCELVAINLKLKK